MEWRSYTCIAEKNYALQYAENCQKIAFANMHYAQVLKKLILSASFSMLPILINVSKLFFPHNIAPRMNGILENLHLENSINLCIWGKKA